MSSSITGARQHDDGGSIPTLPTHWEAKRLRRIANLITNKAEESKFSVALEDIEGWTGKLVHCAGDYSGVGVAFQAGDVLYGKLRPYLAKTWSADRIGAAVGDFHVIRPNIDPEFLTFFLLAPATVSQLNGAAHGAKMPRVGWEVLADLVVPIPPAPEQAAIVKFLKHETAKIDRSISKQEQMIELLKEKQQASIWNGVTKGLVASVSTRTSPIRWIGEVPAHWAITAVRKVARLESGHTPSKSKPDYWVEAECTIPWFTLTDINQVRDGVTIYVTDTENKISPLGLANSSARLLPASTVFLSRTASVGFSGIMSTEMAVSQDFAAWICGDRLLPEYLLLCLRAMKPEFERLMMGSTHKTIYMPDIEKLAIPLPPMKEQRAIVERVFELKRKSERLIDRAETNIKLLQERRSALISAAVTGKIDVCGYNKNKEREAA